MRQIRHKVFETNSSSVHTITIPVEHRLAPNQMKLSADGYIHISFDDFGRHHCVYREQRDKLSYLLTMARTVEGYADSWWYDGTLKSDIRRLVKSQAFKQVSSAIAAYTNSKGVWIDRDWDGVVDHQTAGDYDSFQDFLDKNNIDIVRFVFDPDVVLTTDSD